MRSGVPPPERMFDALHGRWVPEPMRGLVFAFEIGGVDRGWLLDCSRGSDAVVSRFAAGGAAALSPPPTAALRYRDKATFARIEAGEMAEMTAVMSGALICRGDLAKLSRLSPMWVAMQAELGMGAAVGFGDLEGEARALAALRPARAPRDPCRVAFWRRHCGTDALVGSWLFVVASAFYLLLGAILVRVSVVAPAGAAFAVAAYANLVSAALFLAGSLYFVKLSYPEVAYGMVARALQTDPARLSCWKRYVAANEMLIAMWCFLGAFTPYLAIVAYDLAVGLVASALAYLVMVVGSIALMSIWLVAVMPDSLRANGGAGSSYCLDCVLRPLCCLAPAPAAAEKRDDAAADADADAAADAASVDAACCCCYCVCDRGAARGGARERWCRRHCGSDFLAGSYVFVAFAAAATPFAALYVVAAPGSFLAWATLASALPFLPGSLLMARGAYPETANDSLCCGPTDWSADDDDLERCCCDVCGCCARRRPPAEQALISGQPGAAAV